MTKTIQKNREKRQPTKASSIRGRLQEVEIPQLKEILKDKEEMSGKAIQAIGLRNSRADLCVGIFPQVCMAEPSDETTTVRCSKYVKPRAGTEREKELESMAPARAWRTHIL